MTSILKRNESIISLYDFTGEALRPWADAGYACYAFDIQHPKDGRDEAGICYRHADLHDLDTIKNLFMEFSNDRVKFGMAFPVCTDMAVSGAAHFKAKAKRDPDFQTKAVNYAKWCADFFEHLGVPYFVENPVSVLSSKWRKPDYIFHPNEYGGYIADDQEQHPRWPEYIAARDAYRKKTCLWAGNNFQMPSPRTVEPEEYHGNGFSTAIMKLGGTSQRTKDIRSATPRGFAIAVYKANSGPRSDSCIHGQSELNLADKTLWPKADGRLEI